MKEKAKTWQQTFGSILNLQIVELTGDSDMAEFSVLNDADVICTTPEKLGKLQSPGDPFGVIHTL
jgi:replicative superfamily II helicase